MRLTLCALLLLASPVHAQVRREYAELHMGMETRIVLHARSDAEARRAARRAFDRIEALENVMSDWRPASELRRLEGTAAWTRVSPELFDVLARSIAIARLTDGAFDPTVAPLVALWRSARRSGRLPDSASLDSARALVGWRRITLDSARRRVRLAPGTRLDLGGIAKGWILQAALAELRTLGVRQALIEAGGDIVVGDAPPGRSGWDVAVPNADSITQHRASSLVNAAIASSGPTAQFVEIGGVRYSHVVDPRTGLGLTNGYAATVIAPHGATSDALATALTVIGPERAATVLQRFPDVRGDVRVTR